MASTQRKNQGQKMTTTSRKSYSEPDLSETEIDSYILSIPVLPTKTPKQPRTPLPSKTYRATTPITPAPPRFTMVTPPPRSTMVTPPPSIDARTPTTRKDHTSPSARNSYDRTPRSQNTSNGHSDSDARSSYAPTPRSLKASDAQRSQWAKASVVSEGPKAAPRQIGWFGFDGRAWTKGTTTPARSKPWIDV
ncbi:hypothetical protein LTR08_006914 [Meristemomyces frigidus]|nr:hypothetical protein LTR08_006914 [Meristemomyces frigidus]